MALYKLTAPRKFGDMPKGYKFQVASATILKSSAQDVEKEIPSLGLNKQVQSYQSQNNFNVDKIS